MDRLIMRPFRAEDGAMMYALNEDPEVLQYTGDTQFADFSAARVFLDSYDQYEKYGVGRLVVILKETGEVLGWCGLKFATTAALPFSIPFSINKSYVLITLSFIVNGNSMISSFICSSVKSTRPKQ